jgi:hypothetical protein
MTSSKRSGTTPDFSRQEYKPFNPLIEPGLISVLFLAYGKPKLARNCLTRFIKATKSYTGELEFCLLSNGIDEDNISLFREVQVERKIVLIEDINVGINSGLNSLIRVSRGEFFLILESDWWCQPLDFNFLQIAKDIMAHEPEVGIVQLRDIHDQYENWGRYKKNFNPFSCSKDQLGDIPLIECTTPNGHVYLKSLFSNGWNHNPALVRKAIYEKCGPLPEPPLNCDLRHGESLYQEIVAKLGLWTAHINFPVFVHGGGGRRSYVESLNA